MCLQERDVSERWKVVCCVHWERMQVKYGTLYVCREGMKVKDRSKCVCVLMQAVYTTNNCYTEVSEAVAV